MHAKCTELRYLNDRTEKKTKYLQLGNRVTVARGNLERKEHLYYFYLPFFLDNKKYTRKHAIFTTSQLFNHYD